MFAKNYLFVCGIFLCAFAASSTAQPHIAFFGKYKKTVSVVINNPDGFYVGAMPYVLQIGGKKLELSRHPEDGDIRTLIFDMPAADFDVLKDGDSVLLGYGDVTGEDTRPNSADSNSAAVSALKNQPAAPAGLAKRWSLGGLNKKTTPLRNEETR